MPKPMEKDNGTTSTDEVQKDGGLIMTGLRISRRAAKIAELLIAAINLVGTRCRPPNPVDLADGRVRAQIHGYRLGPARRLTCPSP